MLRSWHFLTRSPRSQHTIYSLVLWLTLCENDWLDWDGFIPSWSSHPPTRTITFYISPKLQIIFKNSNFIKFLQKFKFHRISSEFFKTSKSFKTWKFFKISKLQFFKNFFKTSNYLKTSNFFKLQIFSKTSSIFKNFLKTQLIPKLTDWCPSVRCPYVRCL